jgi:hypothetical protein
MDFLLALTLLAVAAHFLKAREQRRRIALLGSHLGAYDIESLMESLTTAYQRALGEADAARQAQIWELQASAEARLSGQFQRFADAFAQVDAEQARVSTLPIAMPYATQWAPGATFDMRAALRVHATGLTQAANNSQQQSPKGRAFTLLAELMLMQHTCHWFCRSKAVASARLLARHQTAYAQVLEAVSPQTRKAYSAVLAG